MDTPIIAAIVAGAAGLGVIGALVLRAKSPRSDTRAPGAQPASGQSPNFAPVREALSALLTRQNDDAFVIFEQAGKKRFVQFAGGPEGMLLDLPVESLSEAERERAESYFAAIDVRLMERPNFSSFQLEFGQDVDSAARTTLEIFSRVYALPPDFRLRVEEN